MTRKQTKSIRFYDKDYSPLLKYPFKSKYKYNLANTWSHNLANTWSHNLANTWSHNLADPNIQTEPFIPDFKLKACKRLSKPNFSNEPGCWEADLMFASYYNRREDSAIKSGQIYLVMINVNTRYLIVEPMINKSDVINALQRIVSNNPEYEFRVIKCDGESGFISLQDECIVIKQTDKSSLRSGRLCRSSLQTNLTQILIHAYNRKPDIQDEVRNKILHKHDINALQSLFNTSHHMFASIPAIKITRDSQGIAMHTRYAIQNLIDYYPIKFVINSSPYALAHKEVDAVIRTLRNAFGMNDRRIADYNLMRQMVNFYNNTPHSSLRFKNYNAVDLDTYIKSGLIPPSKYLYYTPAQMQNDIDLEWRYIRMMKLKLRDANDKQKSKSLLSYKPGNIILVHLDQSKTLKKHEKRRRVFNEIAEFIRYQNGNVICKLLNPYQTFAKDAHSLVPFQQSVKGRPARSDVEKAVIEVPIIYTKRVCKSSSELNDAYKHYFNLP